MKAILAACIFSSILMGCYCAKITKKLIQDGDKIVELQTRPQDKNIIPTNKGLWVGRNFDNIELERVPIGVFMDIYSDKKNRFEGETYIVWNPENDLCSIKIWANGNWHDICLNTQSFSGYGNAPPFVFKIQDTPLPKTKYKSKFIPAAPEAFPSIDEHGRYDNTINNDLIF